MATTLPARIEEYTALQSQSTFTDAEKAAFDELAKYIRDHTKDTIFWYWDLGQKVAKIYTAAQSKKELYGNKILLRLAIGLGYKTERQLRNAMDVCSAFETKKAFTEYVKLRGEAGNMLQWSHLVYLAGVGDSDLRMQLAAASLEQAWTAETLWGKVKELCERKSRGKRTPVTKVPTSARSCLTHISSQAQKFNFNYDNAWTGDAFDLVQTVKDTPTDKLNSKLLETVRDTRAQIIAMQKKATDMANTLTVTEVDIQVRMEAQAALNTKLSEAAAGEPEKEEEEDDSINLGDIRNAKEREKRAKSRKKVTRPGKKGTKRAGRVGV